MNHIKQEGENQIINIAYMQILYKTFSMPQNYRKNFTPCQTNYWYWTFILAEIEHTECSKSHCAVAVFIKRVQVPSK